MRKTRIYFDASALWDFYFSKIEAPFVKHALNRPDFECMSSIVVILELHSAIKSKLNLSLAGQKSKDTPTPALAETIRKVPDQAAAARLRRDLMLDITQRRTDGSFFLQPISDDIINKAKDFIDTYNLKAVDSIHLATALDEQCTYFLANDTHFVGKRDILEREYPMKVLKTSSPISALPSPP